MSFNKLIGHDALRRSLAKSLEAGEVSHATLITGPAGSGKKSWGRALARALLCLERRSGEACLMCSSCLSFERDRNPGFSVLEPDGSTIKIEQIRDLRPLFNLKGLTRVCMICSSEQMSAVAASSLLITLEEPPPGLYFILLAERADLLFSTIVSRCRHFNLRPMDVAEITALLTARGYTDPGKNALIARIAGGLPGYATALAADPGFEERLAKAQNLAVELAADNMPATRFIELGGTLAEDKELIELMELICLFYRDLLVGSLSSDKKYLLNPAWYYAYKSRISIPGLEAAVMIINNTLKELAATNVNRRLLVEKTIALIQRRLSICR